MSCASSRHRLFFSSRFRWSARHRTRLFSPQTRRRPRRAPFPRVRPLPLPSPGGPRAATGAAPWAPFRRTWAAASWGSSRRTASPPPRAARPPRAAAFIIDSHAQVLSRPGAGHVRCGLHRRRPQVHGPADPGPVRRGPFRRGRRPVPRVHLRRHPGDHGQRASIPTCSNGIASRTRPDGSDRALLPFRAHLDRLRLGYGGARPLWLEGGRRRRTLRLPPSACPASPTTNTTYRTCWPARPSVSSPPAAWCARTASARGPASASSASTR